MPSLLRPVEVHSNISHVVLQKKKKKKSNLNLISGSHEWDDFVSKGHLSVYGDIFVTPGDGGHVTGI